QNPKPGYGTIVTDSLPTWSSNGFDGQSVGVTVKQLQYTGSIGYWRGITNTSKDIADTKGYMVFVRNNRAYGQFDLGVSASVLRMTGTLRQGSQTAITVPSSEFVSIGNPYASALDMRTISKSAGVQEFIYTWDPLLSGMYTVGGYQTFSKDLATGNYEITPGGGSYGFPTDNIYNTIESGQGFLVRGGSGGTLTFNETAKSSGSEQVFFTPGASQKVRANMQVLNNDGTTLIADGILVDYNDQFSSSVDNLDAIKAANTNENVSILRDNKSLIIERRQTISADDTIQLNIKGVKVQNYQWELILKNMDAEGRTGFFIDKYLATSTPLNLDGTTKIRFAIQNIAGSYANDRFMIVFKQTIPLPPVSIPSITASRNSDNTITVKWKILYERNMSNYLVERSGDGIHFTSISTVLPVANNGTTRIYDELDAQPLFGFNYYRVKALNTALPMYSAIVKVDPIKTASVLTVYPNPVTDKKMNLQFNNLPSGDYRIELFNNAGQLTFSTKITNNSTYENKAISLGNGITTGNYELVVTGQDGIKKVHSLFVE
ncbi:MAG TPA: T9SS type A sorting domain-containing protein, partial [Ferruginibacter sp.]|nr:T9SS type A sorting domain-containing protein [Ferruginibacter sp.]